MAQDSTRTFTEQARRQQIVAATVEVIADEGFRAASLNRIAERVGISKPLILYHFASKDEVLRQTLFETIGSLAGSATEGLAFDGPPPALLRDLVYRSVRTGIEHRRERRAVEQIIANMAHAVHADAALTVDDAPPLIDGVENLFRAGVATGDFRAGLDTRVAAITYQAAVDAAHRHFDAHPDDDVTAYADALADLLLGGVLARP